MKDWETMEEKEEDEKLFDTNALEGGFSYHFSWTSLVFPKKSDDISYDVVVFSFASLFDEQFHFSWFGYLT